MKHVEISSIMITKVIHMRMWSKLYTMLNGYVDKACNACKTAVLEMLKKRVAASMVWQTFFMGFHFHCGMWYNKKESFSHKICFWTFHTVRTRRLREEAGKQGGNKMITKFEPIYSCIMSTVREIQWESSYRSIGQAWQSECLYLFGLRQYSALVLWRDRIKEIKKIMRK